MTEILWENRLLSELPVVVYGMGDGADKLFEACEKKGIKISGMMASDGFLRKHTFNGFEVLSLAKTQERFGNFVILLAFGSKNDDVISMIKDISKKHPLFAPDLMLFGENLFDKDFYNSNEKEFLSAHDLLADEQSKKSFEGIINYKLSGRLDYLFDVETDFSEVFQILEPEKIKTAIDGGAYNGDTAREMLEKCHSLEKIFAFEPDTKNFRKLDTWISQSGQNNVFAQNKALWSENSLLHFNRKAARGSFLTNGGIGQEVDAISVDSLFSDVPIDYLKLDVEGSEFEALKGAAGVIKRYKPQLNIALYHRPEDMFLLPSFIKNLNPDYKLYLRKHKSIPAWDVCLYAI